ncbi:MAG: ATP-binding protein, partial [Gemmatimonadota bacterium]|nr:ATP-binding protein [Gemmatimonadota bacterium]
ILTSIMGNISLAKLVAGKDLKEAEELLTESEKASLRAKNLTQQLLTFARGGEPVKKITSLSGLIKDAAEFSLRGSNVQCDYSIPENLWFADVDQGQISQVINNLVINADQAMPDGGTIKVVAANITLQPDHPLPLAQGKYLKISIIDKGTGIPRENRPRIFDPYYTTKQQGSGLGLATSYAIINKHNGHINVESEPEAGSVFHIYLPASDRQPQEKSDIPRGLPFIKGHILVMDDEQMVREVASLMLEHFGHQVGLASEGDEAIRLYQKARGSGRPFDLVIMDLTVPGGMGGQEAVKKLLEIDPEVKAIVSSGYSNDPVLSDYKKHGFRGVVTKPYKLEELKDAVQEVLASQQSDNAP